MKNKRVAPCNKKRPVTIPSEMEVLLNDIDEKYQEFQNNLKRLTNKSGQSRARKNTTELEKMFKNFRKMSVDTFRP